MRRVIVIVLGLILAVAAPGVRAQATMQLGQLIAALQIGDFGPISEPLYNASMVYVTRVTDMAGIRVAGNNLSRVVERRKRHLLWLRAVVRDSRAAMKALERHGEKLEDVIFATTTNDGSAMLYVDDR